MTNLWKRLKQKANFYPTANNNFQFHMIKLYKQRKIIDETNLIDAQIGCDKS